METDLSPEQFSLRWNNFSNNLTSGFISHLTEQDLVDVTLAVEGQLLQAHKLVLSICSPYFKNIFKENPCQHPVIILKDMRHIEIEMLLKFMYQGEVNVRQEDLSAFLKTAQTLQIKGLTGEEIKEVLLSHDSIYELCNDSEIENAPIETHSNVPDETVKLAEIIDKAKKHCDESKKYICRKRRNTSPMLNNSHNSMVEKNQDEKEDILSMSNDTSCDSLIMKKSKDELFDIEHNVNEDKEKTSIITNAQCSGNNSVQSAVEPVTYRLSARGRPQLVHEGYVYNMTSRSDILNRSHYRCAEQHRGCRGKCAVIAERFMPTGVHDHNHPPGYQSEYDYRKKKGFETDSS